MLKLEEVDEGKMSACCNSPIYEESDVCIACGEHCGTIEEEEQQEREEENE